MKRLKALGALLFAAACAIMLWEAVHSLTPARMHARGLTACQKVYEKQENDLNEALPDLIQRSETTEPHIIADGLSAYVHGDTADTCMVDIPLRNMGDFYHSSYIHGLLWTKDIHRVTTKNPGIILVHLDGCWYAYGLTLPQ